MDQVFFQAGRKRRHNIHHKATREILVLFLLAFSTSCFEQTSISTRPDIEADLSTRGVSTNGQLALSALCVRNTTATYNALITACEKASQWQAGGSKQAPSMLLDDSQCRALSYSVPHILNLAIYAQYK